MPFPLLPTWETTDVTALTPEFLRSRNICLLMLDFDNTLLPYTCNTPTPAVLHWLEQMAASGITLCVVSNSKKQRVPAFCEKHGLGCITHAKKPLPRGVYQCLARYGVRPDQALLVGDQIYTDTVAGNLAGVGTVLVRAIDNHNLFLKLRHVAELPFIWIAKNRRLPL